MSTLHELERELGRDLASGDYWAQARLSILRRWVNQSHPETVLDVGCGSGYLAAELATGSRDALGVDIDPGSIAVAKDRDTDAEFRVGDAFDLVDVVDLDSVDTTILADIIEHFDDPTPILSEAARVTQPDGRILVSVPANQWLFGPHDENQGHARRYTPQRLAAEAADAGLSMVRWRYTNFFPLPAYAVFQRVLQTDVPTSVRGGQSSGLLAAAKKALLRAERAVPWPTGVTLIAEFALNRTTPEPSVLMVNYEYPPGCGGGGVFTRDLRDSLRRAGHDVELVAGRNQSAFTTNSLLDLMAFPLTSYRRLKQTIDATDPDVLNGHFSLPSSLLLPRLAAKFDIPYIVNVMGADVHDPTRYERLRPMLSALNDHYVLRRADAVVVPSRDMASRLDDRLAEKTHVIPYYVDTDWFTPSDSGAWVPRYTLPLRLLTVARLVPRKNLETALAAVHRLRAIGLPVRYTIVGEGSERDHLEAEVLRRDLSDVVEFRGYVDEADLPATYREHDVFVLPSHHEAFGIAVLEAMACGLPVVASDTGGQTDIVTDAVGATCPPDEPGEFSRAIARLERQYETRSQAARARVVTEFSEAAAVERYRELFAEVVE